MKDRVAGGGGFSLCDAACGNGRFEAFALEELPCFPWRFTCIDGDRRLLEEGFLRGLPGEVVASVRQRDLLEELLEGPKMQPLGPPGAFDAVVSFGFMHHIPGAQRRFDFVEALLEPLVPGGLLVLSFWRFADDPAMAAKARAITERGRKRLGLALETGDYLLGWQGDEETLRFCHSFSDQELQAMVDALRPRARLLDRFRSDGRNGAMNEYLVFTAGPSLP